ncbi:MAG: preprotein translocase subunit YajC [Actinobacteria bacterium]|nr:preprotein translocase subunit YajC [Actinomycetota bacterium]
MDPFLLMLVFMLLLFVAMNYFGKKKTAQIQEQRRAAIVIGNAVRTHSGFFGTVVDIDGDTVTLESPSGVETMWHKDSIFGAQVPPLAPVDDAAEDATADGPAGEDRAQ